MNAPALATSTLANLWLNAEFDTSHEPIVYLNGTSVPPIPACGIVPTNCQAYVAVPDALPQQLAECTGNNAYLTKPLPTGAFCYGMQAVQSVLANGAIYCANSICWNVVYETDNAILPQCGGSNQGR